MSLDTARTSACATPHSVRDIQSQLAEQMLVTRFLTQTHKRRRNGESDEIELVFLVGGVKIIQSVPLSAEQRGGFGQLKRWIAALFYQLALNHEQALQHALPATRVETVLGGGDHCQFGWVIGRLGRFPRLQQVVSAILGSEIDVGQV